MASETGSQIRRAWDLVAEAKTRVENLSADQVETELAKGRALLVDVREAHERTKLGAIPGALHVPRGELEFMADPSTPLYRSEFEPARRIILHCAKGGRSALAADTLQRMGYTNVAHLDVGFEGWRAAGKPVESITG